MPAVVVGAAVGGGIDVVEVAVPEEVGVAAGEAESAVHDAVVSITATTHHRATEENSDLTVPVDSLLGCQGADAARTTRSLINSTESQSLFSARS